MQKITPFLWFDHQAEEAANFYVSVFPNSKMIGVARYPEGGPMPAGTVITAAFEIEGQRFTALNGGPQFPFTEAVSFVIHCQTQEEVDHFWSRLTEGGSESQCGWLKDKYGLSWQVTPDIMVQMLQDKDPAKASRVMQAMLQMKKIDIATLQHTYDGD